MSETIKINFCFCGMPATHVYMDGTFLCKRHKTPKDKTEKIGKYSGKSKSPYAFNDYK